MKLRLLALALAVCGGAAAQNPYIALQGANETADGIVVSIPYYQDGEHSTPGSWLPRHLIPLMGSISFEDERISPAITEIVRKDLEHARRQGCI